MRWAPGFHACDQRAPADSNLYLFHIKYSDYDTALRRLAVTREIAWSERALAADWGFHQRESDAWTTRHVFDEAEEALAAQGTPADLPANIEADRFNGGLTRNEDGFWESPHLEGRIFAVPGAMQDMV